MNNTIHPSKIYQFILIGIIVGLGWVLWKELSFLFPSLLGATALYILLQNPMAWLMKTRHMKSWMAALVLMLATMVIIVVPLWFVIKLLIIKAEPLLSNPELITDMIKQINAYLNDQIGVTLLTKDSLMKITGTFTGFAKSILSETLRTVLTLIFMYLFYFFMMINRRRIDLFIRRNLPFSPDNTRQVLNEVTKMVKSNAITIPTVAFVQGTTAFIGYLIFGMAEPVLLGVVTTMASMIPVVGGPFIYIPVVIYTFATGTIAQGVGLALWCFVLITAIDNVARFLLQKKIADIHPVITILGVIVGTKLFGLMGLIFGPLMITLFVILVKIYFNEFGNLRAPVKNPENQP